MGIRMRTRTRLADRTLFFYRYVSLSLASLVYLTQESGLPLPARAAAALAAFGLTGWATWIYRRHPGARPRFKAALAAEMAGIALLVVWNGGLKSPFLWCLLNPVLVAAVSLSPAACWFLLAGGLAIAAGVSAYRQPLRAESPSEWLSDSIPFLMLATLMTLALQLFAKINRDSAQAKALMDESLEHLKTLYRIVETATRIGTDGMAKAFAEFALRLTKSDMAFFWDNAGTEEAQMIFLGSGIGAARDALKRAVESNLDNLREQVNSSMLNVPPYGVFLVTPVKSMARFRGVMGVRIGDANLPGGKRWYAQQVFFLSELCAVILERHQLIQAENQLMIIEEQNRIADEMHDSVSQHLFSIVYAIHSLNRQWKDMPEDQVKEQLRLIQVSSQKASQELRSTIYSLSSRKNNGTTWVGAVRSYLDRLAMLHAIDIRFAAAEEDFRLPVQYQKALYRIISESVGNAIRHGASSRIEVDIRMEADEILLFVEDNGAGFQVREQRPNSKFSGLGIANIQYLVHSFGGGFEISSSQGHGAKVSVRIPLERRARETSGEAEGIG